MTGVLDLSDSRARITEAKAQYGELKACQQYRQVLYLSANELFDRITIAERTDQKKRCLATLVKVDL
ncbi:hypothetical protein, partial [Mycobacterium innocens]|uniref:hypothetical protein n=1 Tax=Mycobacterium innocens TaxID=2341083 RepID=UPI0010A9719A